MNVVLPPALASLTPALADVFPCVSGTCLLGWAWLTVALTLLSAWVVRGWQSGGNAGVAGRLAPVGAAAAGSALVPPRSDVAPRTRAADASRTAGRCPGRVFAAAASFGLRAPPTTDMAAAPPVRNPRTLAAGPSSPSRRPMPRSPGTPTVPDPSGPSGQNPPA